MKRHVLILAFFALLSSVAGVPCSWDCDVTRVVPVRLEAYHGETLDLAATLRIGQSTNTVDATAGSASFLWQTNGMDSTWWQTNATLSADGVVSAQFGPDMDTGADLVKFFFSVVSGTGTIYRASGAIVLRPSPGSSPTTVDLDEPETLNFARMTLLNAPWITATDAASAVSASSSSVSSAFQEADSALATALQTAAQAGSNYTDTASSTLSAAISAAAVAGTNHADSAALAAAQAASNYTDAVAASIDMPSLSGYATEAWVAAQGYLTSHQSLSGYATEAWTYQAITNAMPTVPSLTGYATEDWVAAQGYLTSHQSLSGYATEAWVAAQGYLTSHQSLSGYATESYVQDADASTLSAAQSYARNLSWAASAGNTRLVSLDGFTWQDATGTVWQISGVYGWRGTITDSETAAVTPIVFTPVAESNLFWTAGGGTNLYWDTIGMSSYVLNIGDQYTYADDYPAQSATNIVINTSDAVYRLYYRLVALETNAVDHVLYASSAGSAEEAQRLVTADGQTWQDATGCVWQVKAPGITCSPSSVTWAGISEEGEYIVIAVYIGGIEYNQWSDPLADDWTSLTLDSLEQTDSVGDYYSGVVTVTRTLTETTNLVNRVAYTNDIVAAPSAMEVTSYLRWRADGTSCSVSVAADGTLSADTSGWTEGQCVLAVITLASGASVDSGIELVGYANWPTDTTFVACCYRIGATVYVVPSTTL